MFRSIALLFCVFAFSAYLGATEITATWDGGTGNWSDSSFWSCSGCTYPNNGTPAGDTYAVTIASGAADNVTLDNSIGAPTIDSLTLGVAAGFPQSTLEVTNTTLTVSGSSGVTVNQAGFLDIENNATVNVTTGNLSNSGTIATNYAADNNPSFNTLDVSGTLTNNAGAHIDLNDDQGNGNSDVLSVGQLVNNGYILVGKGATLELISQPNGITDIAASSTLQLFGTAQIGATPGTTALKNLGGTVSTGIEGTLELANGQTTTVNPGGTSGGTLTVSSSGILAIENNSTLTVNGNLTNNNYILTNYYVDNNPSTNTLNVTGTLTNNSTGKIYVNDDQGLGNADVLAVGQLVNNGSIIVGKGATLELLNQSSGITDIPVGSTLELLGTAQIGATPGTNALENLGTASGGIEGTLILANGQTTSVTPTVTLTIESSGTLAVENNSTVTVEGNLINNHFIVTNYDFDNNPSSNTLNVTGTLYNNSGAYIYVNDDQGLGNSDVLAVGRLVNNGLLQIGKGATLELLSQPAGITDIPVGSSLVLYGTAQIGATPGTNALENLGTASGGIEGLLELANGQTTSVTPTSTLTVSGQLAVENNSTLTVNGNLTNSGNIATNYDVANNPSSNMLNVTGTFTNNSGGYVFLNDDEQGGNADVMSVGQLVNNGYILVGKGATLELTGQPSGITDIAAGSTLVLFGTAKIEPGGADALENLGGTVSTGIEGTLELANGLTTSVDPGGTSGGTLTISSTGILAVENNSTMTVNGNLTNNHYIVTNDYIADNPSSNALNVTGTLTNTSTGGIYLNTDLAGGNADQITAGAFTNNGYVGIYLGATLNGGTLNNNVGISNSNLGIYVYGGTLTATTLDNNSGGLISEGLNNLSGTGASAVTVTGSGTNAGNIYTTGSANQLQGNTFSLTGTLTNTSTGILEVSGTGDVATIGTLANSGLVEEGLYGKGASLQITGSGTSTNTGTINTTAVTQGTGFAGNSLSVTGTLDNQSGGSLNINGSGDTATIGTLSNEGETTIVKGAELTASNLSNSNTSYGIQVEGGTLTVNTAVTSNSGLIEEGLKNNGSLIQINGDATNASGGTINTTAMTAGTGVAGNTLNVTGTFTNDSGAFLNINGNGDVATIASLVNQGNVEVYHGATLNDSLNNSSIDTIYGTQNVSGGSPALTNSGTIQLGNVALLAVTGDGNNTGTITTTQSGQTAGNKFTVSGTLTNESTGVLNINGSTDSVTVGTLSNAGEVTIVKGASLTAANLSNSNTAYGIQVEGGTLTVNTAVTSNSGLIEEGLNNKGSLIQVNGDLTNSGTINTTAVTSGTGVAGNTLNVTGTLTNTAQLGTYSLNINGSGDTVTAGFLTNSGTGDVYIGAGASLTVGASGTAATTITMNNGGSGTLIGGGSLTVNGTLNNTGSFLEGYYGNGSSVQVNGNVTNYSSMFTTYEGASGNTLTVTGSFTNETTGAALIVAGSGDLATLGSLINMGTVNIETGATLNLTNQPGGITDIVAGSQFMVEGTFTANASPGPGTNFGLYQLNSIEGALTLETTNAVTITPSSGTLTISSVGNLQVIVNPSGAGSVMLSGAVSNSGMVELFADGSLNVTGAFTNNAGGYLALEQSGAVATLGSLVNNSGSLATSAGVYVAAGATLNDSLNNTGYESIAGTQNISGGNPALTNSGTIEETGGNALIAVTGNGDNSGTITTSFSGSDTANRFTVSGTLTNESAGVVNVDGPQNLASMAQLNNAGQVNVTQGELYVGTNTAPSVASGVAVYNQDSTGVLDEILNGTSSYGVIDVSGAVSLGGTLDVTLNFDPSLGETFDFVDFTPGDLTGTFATFNNIVFDSGQETFALSYNNTDGFVALTVVSTGETVPEPASLSLAGLGLIALGYGALRRARTRSR